ncbi:hypothetical protein LTR66_002331 [Elasticomyces elasticus]|nr:hypothetical protein LTR66_002331 [Elasticomyces elasticus]KAK5011841.1 hypothetical protein LTR28_004358 [Elasticomyces elasticus]
MDGSLESPGSTIPDAPTWDYNPEGSKGDFARLIPVSHSARTAFNEVVERFLAETSWMVHAHRFLHWAKLPRLDAASPDFKWCGYYRLNMEILPDKLNLGWVLGGGRRALNPQAVDLLLVARPGKYGVGGRHCILQHNEKTDMLMVRASEKHEVVIDGKDTLINGLHVLSSRTGIGIGSLSYRLEFTSLDPQVYDDQLASARMIRGWPIKEVPPSFTPTPSESAYAFKQYDFFPPTAGGISSLVSFGSRRSTGDLVLLKKLKRTAANTMHVKREVAFLKFVKHRNVCGMAHDYLLDEDTAFAPMKSNQFAEISLVLEPATAYVMADTALQPPDVSAVLASQILSGIAYLHDHGIMHRDVKPDNIGISLVPEPRAVVLDLGHAIHARTSSDHMAGTVRYLAPEVIALKAGASTKPYDFSADIWCTGISLFEYLFQRKIGWTQVTAQAHASLEKEVSNRVRLSDGYERNLLLSLLQMIEREASDRPSAQTLVDMIGAPDVQPSQSNLGEKRRIPW